MLRALPTPPRGYVENWRHIICTISRGRLYCLVVEEVNLLVLPEFLFFILDWHYVQMKTNPVW